MYYLNLCKFLFLKRIEKIKKWHPPQPKGWGIEKKGCRPKKPTSTT